MKCKRFIASFLIVAMCVLMLPMQVFAAETVASGTCGADLTWTLDSEGTLTISGTGPMEDFGHYDAPWYEHKDSINQLVIRDGVTSIGNYAFASLRNLTEVTVPDGVTSIGKEAFSMCSGMVDVTIPASVTSIGENAFYLCYRLENVHISDLDAWLGIHFVSAKSNPLAEANNLYLNGNPVTEAVVPEGVTEIVPFMFSFKSLTSIQIPDGVTSIGESAFKSCRQLTSIRIPDSVTSIGQSAFEDCSQLTGINIPAGVTEIGQRAFYNCSNLSGNITIPAGVTEIGDYTFFHCEKLTGVVISDQVTSIGQYAFSGCKTIAEMAIPAGVTSIADSTFSFCSNMKTISLPNGITSIGKDAFSSCSSLKLEKLPDSLRSLGEGAFAYTGLTSVTLPAGVTVLPASVFANCESLTSITLPDTLVSIGEQALWHCKNLKACKIPASVTTIGKEAFSFCYYLDDVEIPYGVTAIEDKTFYYCLGLTNIRIPGTVTSIGSQVFDNCNDLDDIYFEGSEQRWQKIVNKSSFGKAEIHFNPDAELEAGKLAVYTDNGNLFLYIGETTTVSAGIWTEEGVFRDPSTITFQLSDSYTVKILDTGIDQKTNRFYVKLEGVMEGITHVNFSDSATGKAVSISLTVSKAIHNAYTLDSMPEFVVDNGVKKEGPVNIYNHNGLYVDSFQATVNTDGVAEVSFDVYNTNCTYAIVEVFDADGNLYNAVLINKMDSLNGSIKEVLWDGTACFVRDMVSGNALTYKQETNYSKRTSVKVEIPDNGYLRITADPVVSGVLAIVNSADLLMNTLSLIGKAENWTDGELEFPKNLTEQLVKGDVKSELLKDGKKVCKGMLKDIGKDVTITSKTVGDFAETLMKNLNDLDLLKIITDNAMGTGVGIAEDTLKDMMGGFGVALDLVFFIGSVEDLVRQYDSFADTVNRGFITIQNQGAGKRHCQDIILESEADFDPEVALQVYDVVLDEALLEKVKNADQVTYDLLMNGLVHTYNISLVKYGEETQHNGDVAVYIPIPDELESLGLNGHIKVFRMEEDGTVTDMDAAVIGDYIMFTTDHFSLYTVVGYEETEKPDDPAEPTDPTKPATQPSKPTSGETEKGEPSDDNNDTQEPSDGGSIVVIVVIVIVVLAASAGVAFVIIKKKKKA